MRAFRRKAGPATRREYRDRDVKLADLVDWQKPVITNAIFDGCHIIGPVIIAPDSGTKFRDCGFQFEESADEVLWEVPPRSIKSGCVALEGCTFRKCTFSSVGIAGGPKIIQQFRKLSRGGSQ